MAILLILPLTGLAQSAAPKNEPGLAVAFKSLAGTASDATVAPNVWLFSEAGKPPAPFLPPRAFSATWEGTIRAELRSDVFFQAEVSGSFKLEIGGVTVLDVSGTGGASPLSKAVQLNKGLNSLRAAFTSPAHGDAFVRLAWSENGANPSPIPLSLLNHTVTPELQTAAELRLGRELFLEYRCAQCHTERFGEGSAPELKMDAPSFEGIGARRNFEWMAHWILDPKSLRPTAHMPKLLRGPKAKENAAAVAAYLASLKQGQAAPLAAAATAANGPKTSERQKLFEKLHCAACHNSPDAKGSDATTIPLQHVAEKFAPGALAEFLRAPEARFAWIGMPNFKLSASDASELANFLMASVERPKGIVAPTEPAMLETGKRLAQNSGCLNCHGLKIENRFSAPKLADLSPGQWTRGCLAAEPAADSKAPRFVFSAPERLALEAFGRTDRLSLTRHVPAEFAERQSRLLNCNGCHGQIELVPALETLGGKLKPEWAARFIAGDISYKPRAEKHPRGELWLEARMPALRSRAKWLAEGLAAQHGVAPQTPPEPPLDMGLAKIGQKLVGKEGGLSCISCHGIGPVEASEVFESEGPNLAHAAERLLPDYYRRWLRSPTSIDPQTKMPVYFDEGKSPLTETLEGDAEKQIAALWQYLRLGDKMPPPRKGSG